MKIDLAVSLEKSDLDRLGDILFEVHDRAHTHEEAQTMWDALPRWLKMEAITHGVGDTCVSDQIYAHLKKQL